MTTALISSIRDEYVRYKGYAEGALAQVAEQDLSRPGPSDGNSLAVICWHMAGNFQSRFTDFLTSDGEKPWRQREEEFAQRNVSRDELMEKWNAGWGVLLNALESLSYDDLYRTITIRGQSLTVHEALHRSLAPAAYHVGQIVYVAHAIRGSDWKYLSIPPGGSAAYNANPQFDKPRAHSENLSNTGR